MGFESSVAYGVKTLIVESNKVPRTLVRVRVRVRVRVSVRVRVRPTSRVVPQRGALARAVDAAGEPRVLRLG